MSNLYNKEIIEHYRNPKNFKKLESTSYSGKAINSVCGDEIYLQINEDAGRVKEVGFQGSGCAICIGAMSILSEKIQDSSIDELKKIKNELILDLIGMDKESPRIKCATLGIDAIHDALGVEE